MHFICIFVGQKLHLFHDVGTEANTSVSLHAIFPPEVIGKFERHLQGLNATLPASTFTASQWTLVFGEK